jgi:hypothetical protein
MNILAYSLGDTVIVVLALEVGTIISMRDLRAGRRATKLVEAIENH